MKISIIGANSFIARNFIVYLNNLVEKGSINKKEWECNLYDVQESHIDEAFGYTQVNFLDREQFAKVNFDVDYIYVFSGKTGTKAGFSDPELYVDVNEMILLNVLTAYINQPYRRAKIIFPSSRLVYKGTGWNADGTLLEEAHEAVRLSEDAEKEVKTIYAANKIACEYYLQMYHNSYDVNYVTVRICVPYGSTVKGAPSYGTLGFMKGQLESKGEVSLFGTGDVKRTFTHMEDICECLYKVAVTENAVNDVYNIGGEEYSLREIAEKMAIESGGKVVFRPWPEADLKIESGDTVFDSSKLDTVIGKTEYKTL